MTIGRKREDRGYGRRCAAMAAAKAAAMRQCAEERGRRAAQGGNARFRKRSSVHFEALAEAVRTEGPEVLSAAAKGYWRDMERANPWMVIDGRAEDGNSLNGRFGRHGKVSSRYVNGKWHEWRNGRWEEA